MTFPFGRTLRTRFMIAAVLAGAIAVSTMTLAAGTSSGAASVEKLFLNWHPQSGNAGPVGDKAIAQLVRTDNGISYQIRAKDLMPGHAYTVWFAVVNHPEECNDSPCAAPDALATPATGIQVAWAGGGVAGPSGTLGFGGSFRVGEIPNGWFPGRGLFEPMTGEIHLVLNDHGPVIPGLRSEMTSTYRAGCTDESLPPFFPDSAKSDGTPGPNTCRLYQIAIFE
jgi:hypothetical protein